MKHKKLLIATIIFFFIANTTYYWQRDIGLFVLVTFTLLILYFLVLTVLLLRQAFFAIREKFKYRQRLFLIGLMTVVLVLSFLNPGGLIDFSRFERDSVFIAQSEGAANCMTTLKLRDDKTFIERNICFGLTEITGTYSIKGDTFFFDKVSLDRHESEFYKFAVIKNRETKSEKYLGDLVLYKDYSDMTGRELRIIKNELTK